LNKEFSDSILNRVSRETISFKDFKRVSENYFYDLKSTDSKYYNLHKSLFDFLVRFFTKNKGGNISLIDFFNLSLFLSSDEDNLKLEYFINMNYFEGISYIVFRKKLVNYLYDCIYLLSNIIVLYSEDYPENFPSYLDIFSVEKIEKFVDEQLHLPQINDNQSFDSNKIPEIFKSINYIFNFSKLREIYTFHYKDERDSDYNLEMIQTKINNYVALRKNNFE